MAYIYNVIILGSGPAGLTAAIYCARANLNPLVIEGTLPGGQLMTTSLVENYPGFSKGVQGPELMMEMRKQAEHFGANLVSETAIKVDLKNRPFRIWADSNEYACKSLIVATGASARLLGLESEKKLMGKGVSTCAVCDGAFFRNQDVVIVGGGDSAIEESLYLSKLVSSVKIIHRRNQLRASKIMQKRAFDNPKISFVWDSVVVDILDVNKNKVSAVIVRNVKTNEERILNCTGVFIAIGHIPNTELFKGELEMDDEGYIKTHENVKTSVEGVFACGDVQDRKFRQAITAAASGCMASIESERYLNSLTG